MESKYLFGWPLNQKSTMENLGQFHIVQKRRNVMFRCKGQQRGSYERFLVQLFLKEAALLIHDHSEILLRNIYRQWMIPKNNKTNYFTLFNNIRYIEEFGW